MPSGRYGSEDDDDRGFPRPPRMLDPRNPKTLAAILAVTAVVVIFAVGYSKNMVKPQQFSWTEFKTKLKEGKVAQFVYYPEGGEPITGELKEGDAKPAAFLVVGGMSWNALPDTEKQEVLTSINDVFVNKGVKTLMFQGRPSVLRELAPQIIILLLLLALAWYFLIYRYRSSGSPGNVLSFGKSRATLVTKEKIKTTFRDVAGIDEAREEVEEIISFLKDPRRFQRLGGRIPKGVLLVGPPGTGKTLLARAIAGEAGVPFYAISGSDFVEMFVGVGASRVRDLFQQAKTNAPCVIFLDEIDAVGRRRGTGLGGGHDEREQTLNAILVEMDGFDSDEKVIVLAATNRPDVLDPALLRPGRFDRHIAIDPPDLNGRKEIFKVYARKVKLSEDIDLDKLSRMTPTFTGANIESMMNEAAIGAVLKDKDAVEMDDLEEARDKVLWGREKRSRKMHEEDREHTAIHEGGHAVVAMLTPEAEPLHKVTIISRGHYLGATMQLPVRDEWNMTRKKLLGEMRVLYGGRAAEELLGRDISSGAAADIRRATEIARRMICEWGMSAEMGPVNYETAHDNVFLGYDMTRGREFSEATAKRIDEEVARLVNEAYGAARRLVEEHREALQRVKAALLDREVLTRDQVDAVMRGEKLPERPKPAPAAPAAPAAEEAADSPAGEAPEPAAGDEPAGGVGVAPQP